MRVFFRLLAPISVSLLAVSTAALAQDIPAALVGTTVSPKFEVAYAAEDYSHHGYKNDHPAPVHVRTELSPNGQIKYRIDDSWLHISAQNPEGFAAGTPFKIIDVKLEAKDLEVLLAPIAGGQDIGDLKFMLGAGWASRPTSDVLAEIQQLITQDRPPANPSIAAQPAANVPEQDSMQPAPSVDVSKFEIDGLMPLTTPDQVRAAMKQKFGHYGDGCVPGSPHVSPVPCNGVKMEVVIGIYTLTAHFTTLPPLQKSGLTPMQASENYISNAITISMNFNSHPTQDEVDNFKAAAFKKYGPPARTFQSENSQNLLGYIPRTLYEWCPNEAKMPAILGCSSDRELILSIPVNPADYDSHSTDIYLSLEDHSRDNELDEYRDKVRKDAGKAPPI